MSRLAAGVVTVLWAGLAFAETLSWQGTTGGTWSDKVRWGGRLPGASDTASFSDVVNGALINVDQDVDVWQIAASGGQVERSPILLRGNHVLKTQYLALQATRSTGGRELILEVPELQIMTQITFQKDSGVLRLRDGLTLSGTGDWTTTSNAGRIYVEGTVTVNTTDAADGTTARTLTIGRLIPEKDATLAVTGVGRLVLGIAELVRPFAAVRIGAGATLQMQSSLAVEALELAAGAKVLLTAGANHLEVGTSVTLADTAAIEMEVPAGLADGVYPVFVGAIGTTTAYAFKDKVTLTGAGSSSVTLMELNGSVALVKGTVRPLGTYGANVWEWTGAVDNNWTESGNWARDTAQTSGDYPQQVAVQIGRMYFGGIQNLNPELASRLVNSNVNAYEFRVACGPCSLTIPEKHWMPSQVNNNYGTAGGILSQSSFPAVMEAYIKKSGTGGMSAYGDSYLQFNGSYRPSGGQHSSILITGDIRFGGQMEAKSLSVGNASGDWRESVFVVLPGGSFRTIDQSTVTIWSGGGNFYVQEGGTLSFVGKTTYGEVWNNSIVSTRYSIDGVLDYCDALALNIDLHLNGSGRVNVKNTVSRRPNNGTNPGRVHLSGGLTLCADRWQTVTTDAEYPVTVSIDGEATLTTTNNLVYGLADDVETTTVQPVDRALRVCEWATLNVDTANPDTGDAQTIAFTDPIIASGTLVKKGAGTLALATAGNEFSAVTLKGGDLAWTAAAAPTFASLTCAGGALAPAVADGAFVPATVTSDTDVSQLLVTFPNGRPEGWATVLKAADGAKLSGLPKQRGCAFRIVAGANGDELQVDSLGFMVLVQ